MNHGLRGLYLVTPELTDTARLLALCQRALAGRPALLQYRCKAADGALRREQASTLLALCRHRQVPFIINDDLQLALEIGADGAHLGRDDGPAAAARQALGPDRLLGVTCYDEFERAQVAQAEGADYVAFGAMFPSATKPGAVRAPRDLLTRAARELRVPVAAIGGITLETAGSLVDAGASLLAVVGDVFADADPGRRAAGYARLFAARSAASSQSQGK